MQSEGMRRQAMATDRDRCLAAGSDDEPVDLPTSSTALTPVGS